MSLRTYEPHKSSLGGTDANIMALLAYLIAIILNFIPGAHWFAWIVPLIIYLMEKDSQLVKFHAAQAFVLSAVGAILYIILDAINAAIWVGSAAFWLSGSWGAAAAGSIIIGLISIVIAIIIAIFEILAMINAHKYSEYNIPFIAGLAEKFREKVKSI